MDAAFYHSLKKPWFTPPPWVFPVVWQALYTLLLYLGITRPSPLFLVHIALNLAWSPLFFSQRRIGWAWAVLTLMVITAVALRGTMPWTFDIYVMWISFAWILNLSILIIN